MRKNMLDFLASTSNTANCDNSLHQEVKSYFSALSEEDECLEWWQKHKEVHIFHLLEKSIPVSFYVFIFRLFHG